MILVTGAAGKTGRTLIRTLASSDHAVRALVRDREQASLVGRAGAQETVLGDLLSHGDLIAAMRGVSAVYLIAPNMHPEEERIGELTLGAARESGVAKLVYHSVLHPQTRAMPHHWQKLQVEEKLFESGLDFAILQPSAYMQNLLAYWHEITNTGVYRVPYGEGAALSLVDLGEVVEVAAKILTRSDLDGGTYELAGPEPLTPGRIAEVLSTELGLPVRSEVVPLVRWRKEARSLGLDGYRLESLTRMFEYYDRNGLVGNPGALERLLGRRPTTLGDFVARTAAISAAGG